MQDTMEPFDVMTPDLPEPELFDDARAAVDRLCELYEASAGFLRDRFLQAMVEGDMLAILFAATLLGAGVIAARHAGSGQMAFACARIVQSSRSGYTHSSAHLEHSDEQFRVILSGTRHPIGQMQACWCESGQTFRDCHLFTTCI